MKISANIPALFASHNITITNKQMSKSLERLSSGKRINSVEDDPTGKAVSNKLQAQLNGLKHASRNSSDAISILQTAEGAMTEVHEMLKRMRELSVQASNDTNTPEDRDKMNTEVQELIQEIASIPNATEFNSMKLLNGSLGRMNSVSNNDPSLLLSQQPSIIYNSTSVPDGSYTFEVTAVGTQATATSTYSSANDSSININGELISIEQGESDASIREKIMETAARLNMDVTFGPGVGAFELTNKQPGASHVIDLTGSALAGTVITAGTDAQITIDTTSDFTTAAIASIDGNRITFTDKENRTMVVDLSGQMPNPPIVAGSVPPANLEFTLEIKDSGPLVIHTGPNMDMRTELIMPDLSAESLGLVMVDTFTNTDGNYFSLLNIASSQGAQAAIGICDTAIGRVSDMRALLGAYSNRMEHKVKSLDNTSVNTQESLSRIMDTDMAEEMTTYSLKNVILKSAISILAQANEQPGMLLQLLR